MYTHKGWNKKKEASRNGICFYVSKADIKTYTSTTTTPDQVLFQKSCEKSAFPTYTMPGVLQDEKEDPDESE